MCRVDGSSDLTEEALDHFEGWRGSRPVRIGNGAADIYGEAMDAIFHADSRGLGAAHQGWMDLTRIIDWLCEHWDQPEESIWETRGGRKDFTYGRFQCGVALDRMIRLAGRRGRPGNLGRWMAERDKIYRQIMARGWHPDRHTFTQHYGSDVLDASLLLMPLMGFVPPPTRCGCPRWRRWTASWSPTAWCTGIPQRLTGWAARARGHFLAVHFLLRGRPRTVGPAHRGGTGVPEDAHLGLYSEDLGLTGEQLGNFPQAFSHLARINAAINLDYQLDYGAGNVEPVLARVQGATAP